MQGTPPRFPRALDRLEESGWIERRQDPDSRRCFRVVLTESGRGVAKGVREAYAEIDKAMFEGFAEEELDRLYAALGKIRSNLNSKKDGIKGRCKTNARNHRF